MGIKFDVNNRKDIIAGGIFLLIAVLALEFIYLPKYREVKRLNAEYKEKAREIDDLYDFIGGRENLENNIIDMRKKLALLEKAFPSEKEVSNVIKQLNEEAKRFNVKVVSLKPKNFSIYKGRDGKELKVADYFCKCMPLSLTVKSRFQDLGEFLISLEAGMAPMVSVKEVDIERDEEAVSQIEAKIDITTYILGE